MQLHQEKFRWLCASLLAATLTLSAQLFAEDAATTRLSHAAQLLTSGNLERAENEIQAVLRLCPDEYRALDLLGVIRILQHRTTDAEELFRRVVEIKPDFASGHAHLGLLYLQVGRPKQAIPELREAVGLDSARTDASDALLHTWREQAQASTAAGDSATALALLVDARKLAPNNPDVQFELGMAALRMSLWQDAIEAFQRTLQLRKDDPMAVWGLGRAFMGQSKFEEARDQFARYVVIRPDDSSGHCSLGMTLAALEHSADARAQFDQSIALAPAQTESYYRLGLLDLENKDLDSAEKDLRHAIERDPKQSGALAAMGRVEFERKHFSEAAAFLRQAIDNDDSLRVAHYYLGLTYSRMGRKPESDRELEKVTQLEQEEVEKQRTIFKISDPGSVSAQTP